MDWNGLRDAKYETNGTSPFGDEIERDVVGMGW
jgi:hypothetical protein